MALNSNGMRSDGRGKNPVLCGFVCFLPLKLHFVSERSEDVVWMLLVCLPEQP